MYPVPRINNRQVSNAGEFWICCNIICRCEHYLCVNLISNTTCSDTMADSNKKTASSSKPRAGSLADVEAIADSLLEKQRDYLEARFNQLEQMGKDTEGKLCAIQTDLMTLRESIGTVNAELGKIRAEVRDNSSMLSNHESTLEQMQLKLADMEDHSRRCNVRIVGLAEGVQGSNAGQFLTNSLPKWFPSLGDLQGEIMRAHRIYGDNKKRSGPPTMICNVLRFTTCRSILRAARKNPVTVEERKIRFPPTTAASHSRGARHSHKLWTLQGPRGLNFPSATPPH